MQGNMLTELIITQTVSMLFVPL